METPATNVVFFEKLEESYKISEGTTNGSSHACLEAAEAVLTTLVSEIAAIW